MGRRCNPLTTWTRPWNGSSRVTCWPCPVPLVWRLPMTGTVQKIDLASQAFARDPFPTYARLREAGPVLQTRLPLVGKAWVATTHQAASEVLKDDETFVMEAKKVGKTLFSGIFRLLPRLARVF